MYGWSEPCRSGPADCIAMLKPKSLKRLKEPSRVYQVGAALSPVLLRVLSKAARVESV